jgi:hypothetical protein
MGCVGIDRLAGAGYQRDREAVRHAGAVEAESAGTGFAAKTGLWHGVVTFHMQATNQLGCIMQATIWNGVD